MKTKQDILNKYNGISLNGHPCEKMLSGYKTLTKPFLLSGKGDINTIISRRNYRNRIKILMNNVIKKFKENHSINQ